MNSLTGFQLAHPHTPARAVRAESVADVIAAVTNEKLSPSPLIAVQATGHGRTRGMSDGTLIDTSGLDDVTVDSVSRTVTVGAGTRFSAVIAAAAQHGLAPLSGSFPAVGVVGYCLSGGFGLLSRAYGFGADSVTEVELVTPDARRLTASPTENPELFWGVRGAGSNFGIVTSLTMRLFPVTELIAGSLSIDLLANPGALQVWRDWAETQSPDMMTAATLMAAPTDAEDLPPFLRGAHRMQIQVSWSGEPQRGLAVIDDLKSSLHWAGIDFEPTVDRLPFSRSGEIFAEPADPHGYTSEAFLLSDLDDASLERMRIAGAPSQVPTFTVTGIRILGGKLAQPASSPNAIGHRNARWLLSVLSPLEPSEQTGQTSSQLRHLKHISGALDKPDGSTILGRALNFTFRELDSAEVASAFEPEDYGRLCRLRDIYDPDRVLMPQFPL
ncbi:FAD-binding oxidoreductase [Brevibacterium spongiae]|uniref:FAD-binding oxidoreductase n=1 Tax=Brevibacterium spongiae TaxID=2909672 RepID=A0ABY5SSJ5_9MICO|nr:FAD-binding oxidoreductase [Brevibacterium spongiae]UVI37523.1 FAD-binding oxidoreductase [Brevibacterium spongiae]